MYPENGMELSGVGAGPVPARCPVRGISTRHVAVIICPVGQAGWHKACPYTGGAGVAKRGPGRTLSSRRANCQSAPGELGVRTARTDRSPGANS